MTSTLSTPTEKQPAESRIHIVLHKIKRAFFVALGVYIVLLVFLYFNQRQLIFPGGHNASVTTSREEAETRMQHVEGVTGPVQTVWLKTSAGQKIAAMYAPSELPGGKPDPGASSRPTVIYFYGNGSSIERSGNHVQRLRERGVNVFMPDFIGYGMSDGEPSETGCYATATAAYDYITGPGKVSPGHIVIMGRSLGTALAIDLAARRPCAGLVTVSAFTSMAEMACHDYPFVPLVIGSALLKHKFLSESKIPKVQCPIMIVHARDDIRVPFSMAAQLEKAAHKSVTRIDVPTGGHNQVLEEGGKPLYTAMAQFIYKSTGIEAR